MKKHIRELVTTIKPGSSKLLQGKLPLLRIRLVIVSFLLIGKIHSSMAKATTRCNGLMILEKYLEIVKFNERFQNKHLIGAGKFGAGKVYFLSFLKKKTASQMQGSLIK